MSRDLMHTDELKAVVRDAYAAIDSTTEAVAYKLYSPDELAQVPSSAIEGALGVGNHLRFAQVEEGETVLDLGCGAGIDSVLAAQRTGPSGRVIALDFLPEMLERTSAAAAEAGLATIDTLEAEMEAIPLADESVDHVISNGVINLSARKRRVLAECARVLRPGGKLSLSDLTVGDEELPPEVLLHPATWAGWVAGALTERDFVEKLEKAGFEQIVVHQREPVSVDDLALYPLFTPELIRLMRTLIAPERQAAVATSVVITARRA